jgi:hypothetical protein
MHQRVVATKSLASDRTAQHRTDDAADVSSGDAPRHDWLDGSDRLMIGRSRGSSPSSGSVTPAQSAHARSSTHLLRRVTHRESVDRTSSERNRDDYARRVCGLRESDPVLP